MKIDPEFRALIPPLTAEEREQLEANLVAHGCRDPLVLWHGILIDGHNRHEICERLKIKYRTVETALESREHVLLWIEENQLGRRNLTDDQRAPIVDSVVERRKRLNLIERAQKGGKAGGAGRPKNSLLETPSNKLNDTSKHSRRSVSRAAKVSEWKVRQVREIKKKLGKAAPATLAKIRSGEKTILEVKREIHEEEREAKREANRKLIAAQGPEDIVFGTYSAVVIDPPWDWGDEGDNDQFGRGRPTYSTMTIEQIEALPVAQIAAANAHLYLWITNRSLPKGFQLLEKWGFRYVTLLTWCKPSIGMGNYFRGSTEHVLFGVRGSLPLLVRNQGTHFTAARSGPHSTKPVEFYELVERCSQGPWLEMFARAKRKGWAVWGAESGTTSA